MNSEVEGITCYIPSNKLLSCVQQYRPYYCHFRPHHWRPVLFRKTTLPFSSERYVTSLVILMSVCLSVDPTLKPNIPMQFEE